APLLPGLRDSQKLNSGGRLMANQYPQIKKLMLSSKRFKMLGCGLLAGISGLGLWPMETGDACRPSENHRRSQRAAQSQQTLANVPAAPRSTHSTASVSLTWPLKNSKLWLSRTL